MIMGLLSGVLVLLLSSQSTAHIVKHSGAPTHGAGRGEDSRADGLVALVAGRRDPRLIVVDLKEARDPANQGTDNAVVSRVRVTPDMTRMGTRHPTAQRLVFPATSSFNNGRTAA